MITPAINSAGHASQQRQEETEQEGERGQSSTQWGLRGEIFIAWLFTHVCPSMNSHKITFKEKLYHK
jgi:hypothetical protein